MGIISVEHMNRLFWLGRYSERAYTTMRAFSAKYDSLIDAEEADLYKTVCKELEIPDIYQSPADFCNRYCFDDTDENSIYSNLMRAYDNAIVLREEIGSEPLSFIQLAVYAMNRAARSDAPLIELQKVTDNILAFWGICDDQIKSEHVRNIMKVGKRVERIDLLARLRYPATDLSREVNRLTGRIDRTGLTYRTENLRVLNVLVRKPELEYKKILEAVEGLVEI